MKKTIIKSSKTKDQAIKEALLEINKTIEEVEIEVIEEESSGFLGLIGQKDALVKITYEDDFKQDFEKIKEDLVVDNLFDQIDTKEEKVTNQKDDNILNLDNQEDKSESILQEDIKEVVENNVQELVENSEDKQKENIEKYYRAKEFLREVLEKMHFYNVKVIGNLEGNIIKLDAKINEQDTGIAIGRGGKNLDAIELIIRKSLRVRSNDLKINIDINNYKKRRDDKIIEQADNAARKVLKTRKRWNLKYMNSYERRLAHEQISKYDQLTSYSEGIEPKRFVVVGIKE